MIGFRRRKAKFIAFETSNMNWQMIWRWCCCWAALKQKSEKSVFCMKHRPARKPNTHSSLSRRYKTSFKMQKPSSRWHLFNFFLAWAPMQILRWSNIKCKWILYIECNKNVKLKQENSVFWQPELIHLQFSIFDCILSWLKIANLCDTWHPKHYYSSPAFRV